MHVRWPGQGVCFDHHSATAISTERTHSYLSVSESHRPKIKRSTISPLTTLRSRNRPNTLKLFYITDTVLSLHCFSLHLNHFGHSADWRYVLPEHLNTILCTTPPPPETKRNQTLNSKCVYISLQVRRFKVRQAYQTSKREKDPINITLKTRPTHTPHATY
jgi:hypothetical protein